MKKMISTILISILTVSSVFAAPAAKKKVAPKASYTPAATNHAVNHSSYSRNYGLAGCGLGSQVMDKNSNQIFAATTNGTGGQVFAITSGTSNCVETPTSAKADRMDKYIIVNKVALADDIARGEGETIQGLAQIMNCQQADLLGPMLQSKFSMIFTSHDLPANEVTDHIITVVGQDDSLASACGVTVTSL